MSARVAISALALWSIVLSAAATRGQDNDKSPTSGGDQRHAADLFDEGRKLLEQQRVGEACAKFEESIRLDSTAAGTMLNLGLCNEELGKYKTALVWFRRGQKRAAETNLPEAERAAKEHTAALALKVATVRIAFAQAVGGATVTIDGDRIKREDYARIEVDPGHHALVAEAPAMKTARLEFEITDAGGQTLTVAFVAGNNTVLVDRGGPRRRLALYTLIGGGVLLGADGAVAAYAHQRYCDAVMNCGSSTQRLKPIANAESKANSAQSLAAIGGTTLFVAGIAGVVAAGLLYFTAPQPERVDQTVFAPTLAPDRVGFSLSRTF